MQGDGQKPNWKDIAFKVLWTAVAAVLAYAGTLIVDAPVVWIPILTPVFNFATAWVRQQLGATPPEAPKTI